VQTNSDLSAFRRRLNRWFADHARSLPWRGTRDPYRILVSEIMLQQTQVASVLGHYARWMERFPDFAALAAADESDVLHAWQGLGYYSRARNLHRTACTVATEYGGTFPRDLARIRSLPGIGRYTAGAVATFAFDESTPIVDANIARVISRIFAIELPIDKAPGHNAIWSAAESLLPARNAGRFNAALMELGALVYTPHNPQCSPFPVRTFCIAEVPDRLPVKTPRRKTIRLEERAVFVRTKRKILLNRETGKRWRGLWRLPQLREPGSGETSFLTRIQYPITHHLVTLTVLTGEASEVSGDDLQWFSEDEISILPMPSPHRKALTAILAGGGKAFAAPSPSTYRPTDNDRPQSAT
jgi:A/G-specific adenine glycosylase